MRLIGGLQVALVDSFGDRGQSLVILAEAQIGGAEPQIGIARRCRGGVFFARSQLRKIRGCTLLHPIEQMLVAILVTLLGEDPLSKRLLQYRLRLTRIALVKGQLSHLGIICRALEHSDIVHQPIDIELQMCVLDIHPR